MNPTEDISFTELKKEVHGYTRSLFVKDFLAALSVTLISIPMALAYSIVLGLPAYCGLVSTIFGTVLAAVCGSSKHLIIGPNNTTVLLVQSATAAILSKYYPLVPAMQRDALVMEIMAALLLLMGIFQIAAAFLKLGRVIQFVSFPVVIGFVLGSSVALVVGQTYTMLGIETHGDDVLLIDRLQYLVRHITDVHAVTAFIGIMSLAVFVTLRKLKHKAWASLLMLIVMTILVHVLGSDALKIPDDSGRTIGLLGDEGVIQGVLPIFEVPLIKVKLLNILVPVAFAIAFISMLETTSLSKSVAATSGQRISVNQEIFGLGVANFVISFLGGLPASSSISRTTANVDAGGVTRFSAVFSSVLVIICISFFGKFIQYVPLATLAALIVATALRAVDFRLLVLSLKATHSDAFVLLLTFVSCFFFSLHIAFYIGVMTSIVLYLRKAAQPRVLEYSIDEETLELRPMLAKEKNIKQKIRVINIEGELFFGAVDLFQSTLKAIAEDDLDTEVFVVRLKHVRDFDATAATCLKQLYDFLSKSGRNLIVAAIPPPVWEVIENAKLVEYIGKENLFPIDQRGAHVCVTEALQRARQLVK